MNMSIYMTVWFCAIFLAVIFMFAGYALVRRQDRLYGRYKFEFEYATAHDAELRIKTDEERQAYEGYQRLYHWIRFFSRGFYILLLFSMMFISEKISLPLCIIVIAVLLYKWIVIKRIGRKAAVTIEMNPQNR